jgi:hypothetical protein
MNGPFVIRQAKALAQRLQSVEGGDGPRVDRAYRLAFARPPTAAERDRALAFLRSFGSRDGAAGPASEAWSAFCQALFASAEFRCLD